MPEGTKRRRWITWLVIVAAGLVVAVVGGPYVYIHFIAGDAPAPLTVNSPGSAPSTAGTAAPSKASGATEGTWGIGNGSVVGYRVNEVLFGQNNVAVGRTSHVTGSITVKGSTVSAAQFKADLTTVTSDEGRRDEQFNGRIMQTGTYPTATFTLTKPIELGSVPAPGADVSAKATGDLTMHGVTKSVTFSVTGRYDGTAVHVAGQIPITFADWNIANPSFGPVSTEDHGVLEFSLNLTRSA